MTIQAELTGLVKLYSKWDQEKKQYTTLLDKNDLLKLDKDFNRLINKILLTDGPEKETIEKYYKKLLLLMHPDRAFSFLPEIDWLEKNLSTQSHEGICFKTLRFCYEKLTNPQKFKDNHFNQIKTQDDLKKWLEGLKEGASTYTGRSLYDSLLGLLEQSGSYFNEVGKVKQRGLRTFITWVPVMFSSYGAFIFSQELFAIYALYFVVLKGGQYLMKQESNELQSIGQTLQELTLITATTTTTLLVRMLELTFWFSHQCYSSSMQIGSAFFKPLLPPSSQPKQNQSSQFNDHSICTDLILASQNMETGIQFKTPELKLVSASLESYLGLNYQQYFSYFRKGWDKKIVVEACLFKLQVIDKSDQSIEDKLKEAKQEIEKLKDNPDIYSNKTALAVDNAEKAIALLISPSANNKQLVACDHQLSMMK